MMFVDGEGVWNDNHDVAATTELVDVGCFVASIAHEPQIIWYHVAAT